ncbi:hypothetical protein AB0P19_02165 [Microbacterium oleivorans]|uniref:hypothetical protein n=1 Tax=Microbacterium oleivorans TaxID=273677 RepID=UPI0034447F54
MNDQAAFLALTGVVVLSVAVIALGFEQRGLRRQIRELDCELERRAPQPPHENPDAITPMNVCRGCGADELVVIMAGCTWVAVNLCSSCADDKECDERAAGERA